MIVNILILIILIGLAIAFGLIQKTANMIGELQINNDINGKHIEELRYNIEELHYNIKELHYIIKGLRHNIEELRYNIGLPEFKIKQPSTKKKKVNDVTRLKTDKAQ